MPSNTNKSPVVHVEHNLGLQSWCVKYVYEYAHRLILRHRVECSRLLGSAGTATLGGAPCIGTSVSTTATSIASNVLIKYLNCAILINPDVSTFWNLRRQLFAKNRLDITKEFQFAALVLSKKPKSNEAFAYRRWLYLFQSSDAIDWSFEIALCEKCADKSNTNYHAWCHRQWVIMKSPHLLKFEIYKTEKFIRKHIHDYSCYNHRQFVLTRMYETTYFDEDDGHNVENLSQYVSTLIGTTIESEDDLLKLMVPCVNREHLNVFKLRSFMYCLNLAGSDLNLCEELASMYGASQAFENHRRFMVKFIVDRCRNASNTLLQDVNGQIAQFNQPLSKMTKLEDFENSAFLLAIKGKESQRNAPQHKAWCKLFLGFDID
ncbi:protein prenyltransferase alpha subunit repeat-containing protein 1-B isoform X2 [Uranotaenia lowii]|nr:protein prenyltransferase alpha subunit repeat-containing protein 1-B isoform X2 [Uranotaenia lowii]